MRTSVLGLLLSTIEASRQDGGRPEYDEIVEAIERIKNSPEINYNLDDLCTRGFSFPLSFYFPFQAIDRTAAICLCAVLQDAEGQTASAL